MPAPGKLAILTSTCACVLLALAFVLGRTFPFRTSSDVARLPDPSVEKIRAGVEGVQESIRQLTIELHALGKTDATDFSVRSTPSGVDGKLGRLLVTESAEEKRSLAEDRLKGSSSNTQLTAENVSIVASDLQAMNAILTSPEHLDSSLLDRVETERNRLMELLKTQIPPLVKSIDDQAVKEPESHHALGFWAKAGAMLGYYPASNIPGEAQEIQQIVTAHELVRTRIALVQKQRYNVWACESIKKAWQDFADTAITSNQAKLETCKRFLGPIDTNALEPIGMELYRDFLDTIKNKVSKDEYQSLATSLVNAKRVLPGEQESTK